MLQDPLEGLRILVKQEWCRAQPKWEAGVEKIVVLPTHTE